VRDELLDVLVDRLHRRRIGAPIVAGEREQTGLRVARRGRLIEDRPVARLDLAVMALQELAGDVAQGMPVQRYSIAPGELDR
jgi:hypothetical protein